MKVLVVTHYFANHGGGVEIVADQLAKRLVARGVEVAWVASDEGATSEPDGVTRTPLGTWNITEAKLGFPYPLWSPAALARLEKLVRDCDVVHLHDSLYLGNVVAYLWARRLRKPVVVTQHVGPIPYKSPLLRGMLGTANRTLARLVLGGADQVVFISPRVERYFEQLFPFARPPLYVANGVDTARFSPVGDAERAALRTRFGWPADRKVRLFVGRWVEKKGLPFLRELATARPQDLWVFIGHGTNDPASWGLANVVSVGRLPQAAIVDYYRAADTLVLPSVGEGFPLVVQEAMACGLPAVISAETMEGAPPELDAIESADLEIPAWQAALDRLDRRELRARVAEVALEWSWDDVADRFVALYESLYSTVTRNAPPSHA